MNRHLTNTEFINAAEVAAKTPLERALLERLADVVFARPPLEPVHDQPRLF